MPRSLLCALLFAAFSAMANPTFAWMTPPALNPANGHYYAFFSPLDGVKYDRERMSFDLALSRAASMSHQGIPGHLVTITSQVEQDFLYDLYLQHDGANSHQTPFNMREVFCIAASDAAVEGEWRWVAGPEAGQVFWQRSADDPRAITGHSQGYQNWRTHPSDEAILWEPNDYNSNQRSPPGEDYATLYIETSRDTDWSAVFWNDVNQISDDDFFVPHIGIVEFSPVPEPSSGALLAGAALLLLSARRPRR